jgi:hypothetical protein
VDGRKPRDQFIYIGCDKPFDRVGYSADSFILPDDGNTYYIFHQREYQREKKPKTIYALFQFFGSREIAKDPLRELLKYDRVYAIDTNYSGIAVTTVMSVMVRHRSTPSAPQHVFTRSFQPISDKPEREAWLSFIQEYNTSPQLRYCLIVDSELGSLMQSTGRKCRCTATSSYRTIGN